MRRTHRPVTVAALILALFMAAMEMTVVSTAMPTVIAELGGALRYAWVFSAYMLTTTVTVPIYGKLADLYGRKPVMLVSMVLFLVGSMASGQARSMEQLIFFRALQGIGAGGMQPIAMTIIGDIFALEERAKMQAVFGAVWAVAGLVGPIVGGIIVAALSWRWVFYVNVPFGILAGAFLAFGLVEDIDRTKRPRLDVAGALTLSGAVVALLLGTDGVYSVVLLPASAILGVLFLVIESSAPEPMLPLSLFRQRALATTSTLMALGGGAMIGIVTFLPLYAQGILGATPTQAGTTIALMAVTWPIASAISGRLMTRLGFRALVRIGMGIVALSTMLLAWVLRSGATNTELLLSTACFGVGMGLANTALVIAVQTSVGFSQRGVATASTMFFRNIGGTVSVGVLGVVFAKTLLAGAAGQNGDGASLVARILGPERKSIPKEVLDAISGDLALGLSRVGIIIAGMGIVAAAVALLFPNTTSAESNSEVVGK